MNLLLQVCMLMMTSYSFPDQPDIRLDTYGSGRQIVFFAPHGNESIANAYLQAHLPENCSFLVLSQKGTRHVHLEIDGHTIEVDPNRIFTSQGARQSLLSQNKNLSHPLLEKAMTRALALSKFIIAHLGSIKGSELLIAVHNNTKGFSGDGNGGEGTVSMLQYEAKLKKGARFIQAIHLGAADEDDLFFATWKADFERLQQANWNVVLQSPQVATDPQEDDGSLSVWAQMAGIRYLNIEAQRKSNGDLGEDHIDAQVSMIEFVLNELSK